MATTLHATRPARHSLTELAHLRDRFDHTMHALQSGYDQARDGTRRGLRSADRYVHRHPYRTLGLAAVAAGVIGLLIARRD